MMAHPLVMAAALARVAVLADVSLAIVVVLAFERAIVGVRAAGFAGSRRPALPCFHLLRDVVWICAMPPGCRGGCAAAPIKAVRQHVRPDLQARAQVPGRTLTTRSTPRSRPDPRPQRGRDAAARRRRVSRVLPDLDVLVIDDGSTDDTPWVLQELGVRCLRFPDRMGIGSAMRAGLRYAARRDTTPPCGSTATVSIDADDIDRLLAPLRRTRRRVARIAVHGDGSRTRRGPEAQGVLGRSGLYSDAGGDVVDRHWPAVTDPTSGFCAFGLARCGFSPSIIRRDIRSRSCDCFSAATGCGRRGRGHVAPAAGRTHVADADTASTAAFRVLLAILIVPLRDAAVGSDRD